MKIAKLILFVSLLLTCAGASAQFSISKVKPSRIDKKEYVDTVSRAPKAAATLNNQFVDPEFSEAERRRIRKERNTTTFTATLALTQTQFENWTGGMNTFSGRSTILFNHVYTREKFSLNTVVDMRYGITYIDGKDFKNEDYFRVDENVSWSFHKNWAYTGRASLTSQFSPGYPSSTDITLLSSFMAPGTLDLSIGFRYTYKTLVVNFLAATGRGTFVLDKKLLDRGLNGVPVGRKSLWTLGPQLLVDYSKNFAKDKIQLRTHFETYTNIKKAPTVRWETWINIPATKYLSTALWCLALYNKEAVTPKPDAMQYNYSIGLTLAYTFRNK